MDINSHLNGKTICDKKICIKIVQFSLWVFSSGCIVAEFTGFDEWPEFLEKLARSIEHGRCCRKFWEWTLESSQAFGLLVLFFLLPSVVHSSQSVMVKVDFWVSVAWVTYIQILQINLDEIKFVIKLFFACIAAFGSFVVNILDLGMTLWQWYYCYSYQQLITTSVQSNHPIILQCLNWICLCRF